MNDIKFSDFVIGSSHPCFIIAEGGVNHNGDIELARRLVDIAFESGVDAIKFQTFNADAVVSETAPKAKYQKETTDAGESQLEMIRRLELSPEAHLELQSYCREKGILFLSTPFDVGSVDFLDNLDVPAYKIGSGEITNWPLLQHIALKGKPIILSTGMSFLSEVDEAVRVIWETGNEQLVLLHCVSNYPADPSTVNLRAMKTMEKSFLVPVGYSDHTPGIEVALAAVALGACVIEKHFTLDKDLPGPDHKASLEPEELRALVDGIRIVEAALGDGQKKPDRSELNTAEVARRSLVAARDIPANTELREELIAIKRPGTGISPVFLPHLIGRITKVKIVEGTLISWEDLT